MRFGLILLVLLFAVLGAVFGALNSESIAFDFYVGVIHAPKGAAFLCALLLGWLVGGVVVYLGLVLRLRRRVHGLTRELQQRDRRSLADASAPAAPDRNA
jgi:lipopolysaccharide assembly protein A